uniref:dockerin type I domain-containing protein n=1 Tax=Candidatus Electrothrix sp. TaxID=2170559 RepID=UPI0040576D6D
MKKGKKGIVLILSFLVLFVPVSAVGATCKKGDANMDGEIDHADLFEIKELMRLNGTCVPVPECADYDEDGAITVFDVRSVLVALNKECIPGDANASGHITLVDICKVEKMIAEKEYGKCADCNEDGVVNKEDITCLQGKVTS